VSPDPVDAAAEYPPELSRLPPGRHGLPRDFVVHNQRERLIAGLAEAVAEKGYGGTTIADITRHAAVSRRTFYEHFDGKDECFVAAFDTVTEQLRERVDESFKAEDSWPEAAKAGIGAMLSFLAAEPNLARLAMVEAMVAGPVVVERYDAAVETFLPYFAAGRVGRPKKVLNRLSDSTEEALVGGMISLISRRIVAGQAEELESLLPDLTEFALAPYVGNDEAAQVARA
jgi:AcrR family transcriptional regulator